MSFYSYSMHTSTRNTVANRIYSKKRDQLIFSQADCKMFSSPEFVMSNDLVISTFRYMSSCVSH